MDMRYEEWKSYQHDLRRHPAPPTRGRSLLLFPLVLLWRCISFFVGAIGIVVGLMLGLAFMGLGLLFCATFIGSIIGIPLFVLGLLILLRALW